MLLLGWAINDDDVEVVRFAEGERAPKILREALRDPEVLKCAWNANFERQILQHVAGLTIPYDEWYDTMVLAMTLSFPGKLEKAGEIIGIAEDKKKLARGKALIRKFCGPRKPTKKEPWDRATHETNPEEWEEFVAYCRNDVLAEREIWRKLRKWDLPRHEWELWQLDQEINEAGIPINLRVVDNAIKVAAEVTERRLAEMKEITGLDNPNSNKQLLPWLQEAGYRFDDLKAGHVTTALVEAEKKGKDELARVLSLRQEVSKSSVKKFATLKRVTDEDGLLRNSFQFAGAQRTWRWGGRNYQPQNLAKPPKYLEDMMEEAVRHLEFLDAETIEWLYPKPLELLSACVRPVVQAPEGHVFLDADLNAIENRVLGWLADDQKILDVFRRGQDPYLAFGVYTTGRSYEDLYHEWKVLGKKDVRNDNKPPTLGCGYMLGAGEYRTDRKTGERVGTGLLGYAQNMGVTLSPEQSQLAVRVFRETFTDVVQFWRDVDRAMRKCIRTGQPTRVTYLKFDMSGPFCRMHLPSGRCLHYFRPRIEDAKTPWGEVRPTITYEGLNDKKQWVRQTTHPGKITENAVQAIARDVQAHGMVLAKKEDLSIRLHVHDQVVPVAPEDEAETGLKTLIKCMSVVPKWAPGLLLGAEGGIHRVFQKD